MDTVKSGLTHKTTDTIKSALNQFQSEKQKKQAIQRD